MIRTLWALALAAALSAAPSVRGDITINNWDADNLSTASGVVNVNADDAASVTRTISNSTTLESVAVTIAASTGTLNEINNPGDRLAVNGPAGNATDAIDAEGSTREAISFTFNKPVLIRALDFEGMAWNNVGNASNPDQFESVEVLINNVLTYTLFSDNADTADISYTSATGRIKGAGDDDFTNLAWAIPASTPLVFRYNANPLTSNGYTLDDITFSVTAVPEASAFLFGGVVVVGLCGWKWRQSRRERGQRRDALNQG